MKTKSMKLELNADLDLIPEDLPSERVIEIQLTAPEATQQRERQPLNLALVIDKSGSMQGAKLEYVKQAALHILDLLSDKDQLAIVTFDSEVTVLAPSAPVDVLYKQLARTQIRALEAGTNTNLGGGWLLGCEQVATHPLKERYKEPCCSRMGLPIMALLNLRSYQIMPANFTTVELPPAHLGWAPTTMNSSWS